MGYRPAEAERAVAALGARVDAEPLADLVREALAVLAPRRATSRAVKTADKFSAGR